mgnify:CR=1 FL=1
MENEANDDPVTPAARHAPSVRERLGAMLERGVDAFATCGARRTLRELQHVLDPAVSEVEGGGRAAGRARWYARAPPGQRPGGWQVK